MSNSPASPDGDAPEIMLPLMADLRVTVPAFRVALRGYDTREVDRYANLVEAEIEATRAAHRELASDVRSLADQLDRANEELAILRRRPSIDDTVAFRHLGPRVEQDQAHAVSRLLSAISRQRSASSFVVGVPLVISSDGLRV